MEKDQSQQQDKFQSPSPLKKESSNRLSQSYGPRLQQTYQKGLLRDNSSFSFQIDMHEYGMPSIVNGKNGTINENPNEEAKFLIDSNFTSNDYSKNPYIYFDPLEYGAINNKYAGDQLIFSETMSSTKIYLTQNTQTEESIVKKIIQKDKLFNQLSHEFAQKECIVHSQMNHENIVKLYEYVETPKEYQLYMEFADQSDYLSRKILDEHTPIKNQEKLKYWAQSTLEALHSIHQKGVIHVDLKLENLLIQSSDREDEYPIPKLCDFGLCHVMEQDIGKAYMQVQCGTQGYIAPEQKQESWVGPEIDMWSFGILLYEMAVAYKPSQIKHYRYSPRDDIPFWHSDWKKRDKKLQDLIKQCLKYNPEKRISAEDALQHAWLHD